MIVEDNAIAKTRWKEQHRFGNVKSLKFIVVNKIIDDWMVKVDDDWAQKCPMDVGGRFDFLNTFFIR